MPKMAPSPATGDTERDRGPDIRSQPTLDEQFERFRKREAPFDGTNPWQKAKQSTTVLDPDNPWLRHLVK